MKRIASGLPDAVGALRAHLDGVNEGLGLPAVAIDATAVPGLVLVADLDLEGRPMLLGWYAGELIGWHADGCDEDRLWDGQIVPPVLADAGFLEAVP